MSAALRTRGCTFCLACLGVLYSHAQFVTLEGRRFMLNGQEFYPVVLNYGTEFVANQLGQNEPEEIYYSPMHQLDRIPQQHFECSNPAQCDQQLRAHFNQIANMGFNTIRLVGASPEAFRTSNGSRLYKLKVKDINPWGNAFYVNLSTAPPAFSDAMSERYFHLISNILDAAGDAGLKVILLTGTDTKTWPITNDPVVYDWDEAVLYAELLKKFAWHLQDNPALLAYDLINEPAWRYSNPNLTNDMSKADVCAMTSLWYDAIAEMDPNHLVTIGGAGKHDIGSWDPAVMKIDFYSPHPYLEDDWAFVNSHDMPTAVGMYMSELYWLAASTEMPWLVGETSFSANDGDTDYNDDPNFICLDGAPVHHVMPYMNGSETDQAAFAAESMAATRAYRGSGFAWWCFQDGRSHPYQSATPAEVRNNYLGVLSYGDGTLSWREKPIVAVVQAYEPPPLTDDLPAPPSAYWNWQALPNNVYRTYHLQDQNQEPVANGIALMLWKYNTGPGPNSYEPLWARSVSDISGTLSVRQPNSVSGYGGPNPGWINVDAPGASQESNSFPWQDGETLEFERDLLTYSRTISGLSIENEDGSRHQALAELAVQNSEVASSGTEQDPVVFEARHWVRLSGELHIDNMSEAWIRTAKVFPDCSNPYLGMPIGDGAPPPFVSKSQRERGASVQMRFERNGSTFRVFPNPCTESATVELANTGILTARDSRGVVVHRSRISTGRSSLFTHAWSTGVYHLTLEGAEGVQVTKLIKID